MTASFVDIHCHLLPGIDDGASDWDESLAMARLAVGDGITTIVATPHQLGSFERNRGDDIRHRVTELQSRLDEANLPLRVLPGADVRIDPDVIGRIASGEVLTLGDHRRHVLLELPHDLYLPLEPLLDGLSRHGITGILSHPERNEGILRQPTVVEPLVEAGCLMQVTAGSLCGTMGPECQRLAESMLRQGLVHFVATDAHGPRRRRPLLRRAHERIARLAGDEVADELCAGNPALVAQGRSVRPSRRTVAPRRRWWTWGAAA